MPPPKKIVATRLRILRAQHPEISQESLASALGVSQNAIGRWERGESEPRAAQILRICEVYKVSADYLIGRSDFENGLAPDAWIVDEDAISAMRQHPKGPKIPAIFKVPRRARIVDIAEAEKLQKELKLERLN